jgi:GT2 family glycosyltransferase
MLLRREAVGAVGGFDERYFLYFEETDLCVRMGEAGWRVLVEPGAAVAHEKVEAPASYYYYYMNRNRYLFWQKNFGVRPGRVALAIGVETGRLAASWALSLINPGRWHRRADDGQRLTRQLRGMVAGARDFRRGRFGAMPAGERQ